MKFLVLPKMFKTTPIMNKIETKKKKKIYRVFVEYSFLYGILLNSKHYLLSLLLYKFTIFKLQSSSLFKF